MIKHSYKLFPVTISIFVITILFSCSKMKTTDDGFYFQDFDNLKMWERNPRVTNAVVAHSGKYCGYTDSEFEFSQTFEMDYEYAKSFGYKSMSVTAWCMKPAMDTKASLVVAIGTYDQNIHYVSKDLGLDLTKIDTWEKISFEVEFPNDNLANSTIKIYLYTPNKQKAYMDDVEIEFKK
jgi:hypothetical protein